MVAHYSRGLFGFAKFSWKLDSEEMDELRYAVIFLGVLVQVLRLQ